MAEIVTSVVNVMESVSPMKADGFVDGKQNSANLDLGQETEHDDKNNAEIGFRTRYHALWEG